MSDCFVGLDLGTSGCRAVAIDPGGNILAEARRPLPPSRHPEPGASEQNPDDWWRAACGALRALFAQQPGKVRAISVDGTSSTLLLCDPDGIPRTPALMYDDSRARSQAEKVAAVAPDNSAARGVNSALARLLFLLERYPDSGATHAAHQADWINGRLAGKFGMCDENNALKLGYDPVERRWPDWLSKLNIAPTLLPKVQPAGTLLGSLRADVAHELGLGDAVPLAAGTTDSNAATLAAGADHPGDAVSSLGSTLVLKVTSAQPVWSARYGVYSHRIGDRWLVGGASNAGGSVLRQHFRDAEIAELSPHIDPDRPLDLGYYPLPTDGERFPYSDPAMRPRLEPRPADRAEFLQAILEGLADIEATGYRRLAELGAPYPTRVYSSGGGAINETWRLIRERKLGVPVIRAAHTEAAYGSALLARAAILHAASASSD